MSLKRPIEILEANPGIKKCWTFYDLGHLFHLGLVRGKKLPRGCLIDERDVIRMFNIRGTIVVH